MWFESSQWSLRPWTIKKIFVIVPGAGYQKYKIVHRNTLSVRCAGCQIILERRSAFSWNCNIGNCYWFFLQRVPLISLRIPVVSFADASSRSPDADIAVWQRWSSHVKGKRVEHGDWCLSRSWTNLCGRSIKFAPCITKTGTSCPISIPFRSANEYKELTRFENKFSKLLNLLSKLLCWIFFKPDRGHEPCRNLAIGTRT